MPQYIKIFIDGYTGYASYVWHEITHPSWQNYFYWLIAVSLFFLILEWIKPWRAKQERFRQDFWLDAFYMFFNFFLFSLIIYNAASDVVVNFFNYYILEFTGINLETSNPIRQWPMWGILLLGFVVRDFVQWWTHRLLHKVGWLWEFHKVHHSVKEMGFAAHLRYHWMETLVYRTIEYLPLALLGIGLYDFFIIHIFTLAVGHYNHSNITISGRVTGGILGAMLGAIIILGVFDVHIISEGAGIIPMILTMGISIIIGVIILGPLMKYIFNHPEMHIWHHAHDLPEERRTGVNFGLTLALWDYIFGTVYMPTDGRDIKLGFPGVEAFPSTFKDQVTYGLKIKK
jgi:sterol desaturase/sphingolipid hydroxylase (fatty acid hydroxylase superfamily)